MNKNKNTAKNGLPVKSPEKKHRTAEELDAEFGSKNWDGRIVELDDGSEVLVAVVKPDYETYKMILMMSIEGKKVQANTALCNASCVTHTWEQLQELFQVDLHLEVELSNKAVELAQSRGRDAKKEPS